MKPSLESNSGTIKKSAVIIVLLLCIVGLFEFLPSVEHARALFPADWKTGQSCHDALTARPWYGQINPWYWFWFISTPVAVFSVNPNTQPWQRAVRTVLIIAVSYVVVNLGTHLGMDIKNTPFFDGFDSSNATAKDRFKLNCVDIADGAKYIFALLFGWIYASIYTGWWEIVWYQYHKRKTKLVDENFKMDWVSKIVVFLSLAIPALLVVLMGISWIRNIF